MFKLIFLTCILISCQMLYAQPGDYYTYYKGSIRLTDEANKKYDSVEFNIYSYSLHNPEEQKLKHTELKRWETSWDSRNEDLQFENKSFYKPIIYEIIRYSGKKRETMKIHLPALSRGNHFNFRSIQFTHGKFFIRESMFRYDKYPHYNFNLKDINKAREQKDRLGNIVFKDYYDWNKATLREEGLLNPLRKKTGTWKIYKEDGTLWITHEYVNDKLHGERKFYDKQGNDTLTIRFINGRSEIENKQDSVKQRHIDSLNAGIKPEPPSEPEKPNVIIKSERPKPQPKKSPPITYEPVAKRRTLFTIQNRELKTIDGAVLIINGEKAKQTPGGYPYIIDSLGGPPYNIIIKHPMYVTEEYRNLSLLRGDLYLRRKGEDYFYEFPFKVPYLRRRQYLLVSMNPTNDSRKLLDSLLQPLQMEVALAYADQESKYQPSKGNYQIRSYTNLYLVKRKDGKEFKPISSELATLRGIKEIDFAGPPLFKSDIPAVPLSFYPRITIQMHQSVDTVEGRKLITELGFGSPLVSPTYYVLHLDPATGMAINQLMDKLQKTGKVIYVEVPLWGVYKETTE